MQPAPFSIEALRLSKTYDNHVVLNGIDLAVSVGETVAVTGANGAGKTTLLRCLAALVRPSSGEVLWFGRPSRENVVARRRVGVLGHESSLYPHLTVQENLLFAARMWDVAEPHRRVGELIEASGLRANADRPVSRLSRGMRQRVAILRTMIHDPGVLLLDEPTSGLDADGAEWLVDLLNDRRNRGCSNCVATHDRRLVENVADRVAELCAGRLSGTDAMASETFAVCRVRACA